MELETQTGGVEREARSIDPVIDILAFFAAMRNYGYVDAVGNALDTTTVLEALGNALRDFRSLCIDASPQAKAKLAKDEKVRCPDIDPRRLEEAVESFKRIAFFLEGRGRLVRFLREVYVQALARASHFKLESAGGEGGGASS